MRKSRRVEGGSVFSLHVLFVNHPTAKGGSLLDSSPSTGDKKQGPVGGREVVHVCLYVCMHVGTALRCGERVLETLKDGRRVLTAGGLFYGILV